jgi:hypothetical protein
MRSMQAGACASVSIPPEKKDPNMKTLRPLFISAFLGLAFLAGTSIVSAQQQASVAISPASIDTTVKAGASYTQNFSITNGTGERLRFHCYTNDMWYDELNQRVTARAGTMPRSASMWIQFTPAEIVIEPNSASVVKATITVPQNATGSFYTVPVFEGLPDKPVLASAGSSIASIGIRFRGLVMLTTETGAEYNVEIMGSKITPPGAASELELALDIRNRGTAHAKLRGAFAILDSTGKLAGRGTIDEKKLLPSQRNIIKGRWAGGLKPGDYTCIVTLSYNRAGLDPVSFVQETPFKVN